MGKLSFFDFVQAVCGFAGFLRVRYRSIGVHCFSSLHFSSTQNPHFPRNPLRCLGQRWLKIIWKMWQTGTSYDAALHMRNQLTHGSWVLQIQST